MRRCCRVCVKTVALETDLLSRRLARCGTERVAASYSSARRDNTSSSSRELGSMRHAVQRGSVGKCNAAWGSVRAGRGVATRARA